MSAVSWIAVDWGTSHLRVWLMDAQNNVVDYRQSEAGMAGLKPNEFATALSKLTGTDNVPTVACGMVGSRQGWKEAPYVAVPCPPPTIKNAARVGDVFILPGVKQTSPPDVMRGEETQIAGYLSQDPTFDGILCLPGTHTKWVQISAGEIVSFKTAMTGELFGLLGKHSLLRHNFDEGWNDDAFREALSETLSHPERLAGRLFQIRADQLLNGAQEGVAQARASGYLIGAELAAMRPYWLGQRIVVIGAQRLAQRYQAALSDQAAPATVVDGDKMVLQGLIAARTALVMH